MRVLLLLTAGLAAAGAQAQTPGGSPAAPAASTAPTAPAAATPGARAGLQALIAADTNKDGKWDKAEWLAAGRREIGFAFLDSDKDGFVTRAELATGAERAKAMGLTAR